MSKEIGYDNFLKKATTIAIKQDIPVMNLYDKTFKKGLEHIDWHLNEILKNKPEGKGNEQFIAERIGTDLAKETFNTRGEQLKNIVALDPSLSEKLQQNNRSIEILQILEKPIVSETIRERSISAPTSQTASKTDPTAPSRVRAYSEGVQTNPNISAPTHPKIRPTMFMVMAYAGVLESAKEHEYDNTRTKRGSFAEEVTKSLTQSSGLKR